MTSTTANTPSTITNKYRTHNLNQLNAQNIGQNVILTGFLHNKRDHGGVLFIDLRDFFGITQITTQNKVFVEELSKLKLESVITFKGKVQRRPSGSENKNLPTGEIEVEIPQPNRLDRGPGGEKSLDEAAALLANAKFPVIISGGGVVMADAVEECKAFAERLGAPVVNSYLHNDSFPASHPLWCGPLGYQGSKAAMKLIAQADVVVALGSRLGPFGTLPQHGMDYWPKNAKIIQIIFRFIY